MKSDQLTDEPVFFRRDSRVTAVVICETLFARLSSGVTGIPGRLAFCRGSNLTLCLLCSFRVVFSLFGFQDDLTRGLVFRCTGFIYQPGGFAFGGAYIARGNDRLPHEILAGKSLAPRRTSLRLDRRQRKFHRAIATHRRNPLAPVHQIILPQTLCCSNVSTK